MAKVFTFVTVIMAIMAIFAMIAISETATSQMLRVISFDNPENVKTSGLLFDILFGTTAGIIATIGLSGAIVASFFTKASTSDIVLASFVSTLSGWVVGDMYTIIRVTNQYVGDLPFFADIVKFYFLIFIMAFIIAAIEFWRGSD